MKMLKAAIALILVILAVTLLTLRVTGLEPQYLDLNDLRAHHMIARPGLWLKGEIVTTPVTNWSFVDKLEHPGRSLNTVLVETRTPYFIPHWVRRCRWSAMVSSIYARTKTEWTWSFQKTNPGPPTWLAIHAHA